MHYSDELIHVDVAGRQWPVVIRTPARLADDPALVITLANTAQTMLDAPPYSFISNPFVEAGHYAVSFHLPYHGELADDRYGQGLAGIAAAHRDGKPGFTLMAKVGRQVLDIVMERALVRPGRCVAGGISRGGLSAMHVTAGDKRVAACSIVAPVTHLPALKEWRGLDELPHVQQDNAAVLIDRLKGRPLYVQINRVDERVGTDRCIAFTDALRDAGGDVTVQVHDAEGHGLAPSAYTNAGTWLLERLT